MYSIRNKLDEKIEIENKDVFDTTYITIPYYDELLKSQSFRKKENKKMEIVQMSPREYFRGCAKIFDSTFDKQIRQVREDKETLEYIQSEIDKGHKLPLTWLDYSVEKSQDGRHRMYVVGNAFGWDEKYPVAVFTTLDEQETERRKRAKEEEKITRYFYWIEDKLLGYSYRDLDELREQVEYLISNYLDNVEVKINQKNKNIIIVVNNVEFTYNVDDFDWEDSISLSEGVDETGDTVLKAVLFHWEEKPKESLQNFEDFEEDGVYKLGNNDYIAFKKRWRDHPLGLNLTHESVINDVIIPAYRHYDKLNDSVGIEIDNLGPRNFMYDDLQDDNLKQFAKYGPLIRKAAYKYFR